ALEYGGPCPPQGSTHRYVFTLYALDTMLELESGANKRELLAAMEKHILAEVEFGASYTR
ncbi:MAG TPA: YbhB/YbcL family Raf kinase inhibitor-like protein, partial [Anaerolineales bacterium]